jgi:calcium/calmodulin-dependent protein kinase I
LYKWQGPESPTHSFLGLPLQVVDKSRYAAGDNSLEREIQVLLKVGVSTCSKAHALAQLHVFPHVCVYALLVAVLQVDHPNCIRLFDVYITPRKVYIVTELVTGGELLDRYGLTVWRDAGVFFSRWQMMICCCCFLHSRVTEKGNYSEADAANLIRQILHGVAYLHAQGGKEV